MKRTLQIWKDDWRYWYDQDRWRAITVLVLAFVAGAVIF